MFIDFKTAKKLCTMEELLSKYNVKLRVVGDSLRGKCPLPTHSSVQSTESFSVSRSKNIWSCKSDSCIAASGRKGGNVLDFVAVMEQCSLPDAAQKLVEWFGPKEPKEEKEKAAPHMETRPDAPHGSLSPGADSNRTPAATAVKPKGYMQEIDEWFDAVCRRGDQEEEDGYYKRLKNAIKAKLIESYKNGKNATAPTK